MRSLNCKFWYLKPLKVYFLIFFNTWMRYIWSNWSPVQPSSTYNEQLNWGKKRRRRKKTANSLLMCNFKCSFLFECACADRGGHCVMSTALWRRNCRWRVQRINAAGESFTMLMPRRLSPARQTLYRLVLAFIQINLHVMVVIIKTSLKMRVIEAGGRRKQLALCQVVSAKVT